MAHRGSQGTRQRVQAPDFRRQVTVTKDKLSIALLCDLRANVAGTIGDHIRAFERHSRHSFVPLHTLAETLSDIDLERFDGIVIHYSLMAGRDWFVAPPLRRRIRRFEGVKAAFVQDDYREINRTVEALAYMRIHALFALPRPEVMDIVYPEEKLPGVSKLTVLTGYVADEQVGIESPPYEARAMDVVYRARKLPPWLGEHALQKWQIAERFFADAPAYGLKVDISCREEDRIYGEAWTRFVANSKAVLGTESGASVCDFTGRIQARVERHLAAQPDTPFEVLRRLYFEAEDGRIFIDGISPRCFEAAALWTLMVMYEGNYSGILRPWEHYVPLRRDHSNMREVVDVINDPARAGRIIRTAYDDLIASGRYSYRTMMALVDGVIDGIMARPGAQRPLRAVERSRTKVPASATVSTNATPRLSWPRRAVQGVTRLFRSPSMHRILGEQRLSRVVGDLTDYERKRAIWDASSGWKASVRSRELPGELWDALALEYRVLCRLQRQVMQAQGTEAWLVLDRGARSIAAVAVWPDRPLHASEQELSIDAFAKEVEGGVDRIEWLNCDLPGLGTRPPFCRRLRFDALARLCRADPALVASALLGHGGELPWYSRIVSVSHFDSASAFDDADEDMLADRAVLRLPVPLEARAAETGLRFYGDHSLSAALQDADDSYAAAIEDQPVPQRVSISLIVPCVVSRVELTWLSGTDLARDFSVTLRCGGEVRWRHRVESNARQSCELETGEIFADSLQLEVSAFQGQQRLLLRRVAVMGSPAWRSSGR